ncbi:MAG: beta-N-acetylhexosaminidase [Pseudomonadota bacterium]|nr:beta-N-acetylhexosaminidase [Pseudomonadota bacterium]
MTAPYSAAIFDPEGAALSENEKAFFRDANPFGFILFARHCGSPEQVKRIVGELKSLTGRDHLPILIDQEGGRVARLKPPHWPKYPPAGVFAALYEREPEKAKRSTYLNARLMAQDLYDLGITVDCAPLADLAVKGAHDIIGDRAFGAEPAQVIALARAMAEGLADSGVVSVLKHIPGHGRARADSHEELPVVHEPLEVLRATDFVPFKALADLPMAMTAHIRYEAIDAHAMATQSKTVIALIREELGFNGLLLSDDLAMKALTGNLADRARDSLAAGCDVVLHCNGSLKDKQAVMQGVGALAGEGLKRAEAAMASAGAPKPFDAMQVRAELNIMLSSCA